MKIRWITIIIPAFYLLVSPLAGIGFSHDIKLSIPELGLTPNEQRWVKENKSIRIAGPRAFPPFHYYDSKGRLNGISADYIFGIMAQLGIRIEVQKDLPWPEVLDRIKTGKIDLIPCIAKTVERERFLDYSAPYLSFPLVILSRTDAPFIGGIEDLYGKKIAVIKGNASMDWLKRDGISFEPFYVDSPIKRLEAVSLGKVDAGIENLAAASYIIQEYGLTNIKIAAPTPYGNYTLHMGVRQNLPELLGIINKVMEWMSPEQHMQIRSKWLSVRYEHGIRQSDILKWVAGIVLAAVVIIAIILGWNKKLNLEIAKRKKLIHELENALAEIKTLKGIVPICSNCKKIRDDKGYWNLLEAFIEEHSEASFSHGLCPECSDEFYGQEPWYINRKKEGKNGTD